MRTAEQSRRLAWIAWATVCVVWGTTYLAIKIALETLPPFLMAGFRYVVAGLLLAGLLALRGHQLPPKATWGRLAVLGLCLFLMGNGGVVWAEQYVATGLAAVLIGTTPFWMVSVDALLPGGRRLSIRQCIGIAIGFFGIVLLVWPDIVRGGSYGRGFALGLVSLQLASIGWSIGSGYTRRHVMPGDVLGSAAIQMICGGLFMLVLGTLTGEWSHLGFSVRSLVAWAYLTVIGGVLGFGAFSYALQYLDVAVVSLYTYINPIIAVALGIAVLGEVFHARMLAAAFVIVIGIVVVGSPPRVSKGHRAHGQSRPKS